MKVKELIQLLLKEDQESYVNISVDGDLLYDNRAATIAEGIEVKGHDKLYLFDDCYRNLSDTIEAVESYHELDYSNDREIVDTVISALYTLEGIFINVTS